MCFPAFFCSLLLVEWLADSAFPPSHEINFSCLSPSLNTWLYIEKSERMFNRFHRSFTRCYHFGLMTQRTATRISGSRAKFRFEKEYNNLVVKGTSEAARIINKTHFVQKYPGSRFVELMKPNIGNPLTSEVMEDLATEFLSIENNSTVNIALFGTNFEYGDVFSTGLCEKSLKIDRKRTLEQLYVLCRIMQTYKKEFASVLSCRMSGTVMGMLLNAKVYLLYDKSSLCDIINFCRIVVPVGHAINVCSDR